MLDIQNDIPGAVLIEYNFARPGEVPEWTNGAVSKTVVDLASTVGSNPTLSAERITFRASSPAATLGK